MLLPWQYTLLQLVGLTPNGAPKAKLGVAPFFLAAVALAKVTSPGRLPFK
jgi:hypothetical protein